MSSSTISKNNQTTIPKEIREKLGLRPGDRVEYELLDDLVILKAVPSILDLAGIFKIPKDKQNIPFKKVREEARKEWVRQAMK
jgi:AbrB family looped-hinge helix DNA binding protein